MTSFVLTFHGCTYTTYINCKSIFKKQEINILIPENKGKFRFTSLKKTKVILDSRNAVNNKVYDPKTMIAHRTAQAVVIKKRHVKNLTIGMLIKEKICL